MGKNTLKAMDFENERPLNKVKQVLACSAFFFSFACLADSIIKKDSKLLIAVESLLCGGTATAAMSLKRRRDYIERVMFEEELEEELGEEE